MLAVLVFSLGGNRIGNQGAIAIGEALKVNTALKTLVLPFNEIGDAGATAMGQALAVNASLTTLRRARFLTKLP